MLQICPQRKSAPEGARSTGVEKEEKGQRMVRPSLVAAVIGLLALTTVASTRPSVAGEVSATRAATPMPATRVAQTSATATTFRWVKRSALIIEKLFMTPSPRFSDWSLRPAKRFMGLLWTTNIPRGGAKALHERLNLA